MKDIIWIKDKNDCGLCVIQPICQFTRKEGSGVKIDILGGCGDKYGHYEFKKEEPVKIQTEPTPDFIIKFVQSQMDNRLQRPIGHDLELIEKVGTWLEENKLENWQTCTRKNTKAGDIVKHKIDEKVNYVIEQIYRETDNCTVWNIEVEKTTVNYVLSEFHIDLNNTEGK